MTELTDRLGVLLRDVHYERKRSTRLERDLELIVVNYESMRAEAGSYKVNLLEIYKKTYIPNNLLNTC